MKVFLKKFAKANFELKHLNMDRISRIPIMDFVECDGLRGEFLKLEKSDICLHG